MAVGDDGRQALREDGGREPEHQQQGEDERGGRRHLLALVVEGHDDRKELADEDEGPDHPERRTVHGEVDAVDDREGEQGRQPRHGHHRDVVPDDRLHTERLPFSPPAS